MSVRKKSSVLWHYFEKDNTTFKAKCNECKDILSYKSSTANLKSHLRRKHPSVYSWVFGADDQPVLTSQRERETRPDTEFTPGMYFFDFCG
ncbi:unnamed protein product [Colias eurytheme]|nr:unnamed protein product [Colias eurytheme]